VVNVSKMVVVHLASFCTEAVSFEKAVGNEKDRIVEKAAS